MASNVSNCTFTGVHWDAKSLETVETVAEGLLQNAKALRALAEVFKAQNIQIESMLRIEGNEP